MKYLNDPVKTKSSGVNSLAAPGENIIIHVLIAIVVEGILTACEAQDIHVCDCVLECNSDAPCPCFAVACPVDCNPVQ